MKFLRDSDVSPLELGLFGAVFGLVFSVGIWAVIWRCSASKLSERHKGNPTFEVLTTVTKAAFFALFTLIGIGVNMLGYHIFVTPIWILIFYCYGRVYKWSLSREATA